MTKQISIDITTLHTDTLIALAADLSHQIDAQDWTADDEAQTLETILAHLYTGHDMDQVDAKLRLAEAHAEVILILTATLITQGVIC